MDSARTRLRVRLAPVVEFPDWVDVATQWLCDEWPDAGLSFATRRQRLVAPDGCPPTLLAIFGDEPIGVVAFRRYEREPGQDPSLFIDALYTRAPYRNRGVATVLLEAAVRLARTSVRELFVYTEIRDFYEKRGWMLEESIPSKGAAVLKRLLVHAVDGGNAVPPTRV